MIERFHRQLKSALRGHNHTSHWMEILPLALLGIRTSLKGDLQASVAELLYGTTLRLPGDFFSKRPRPMESRIRHHSLDVYEMPCITSSHLQSAPTHSAMYTLTTTSSQALTCLSVLTRCASHSNTLTKVPIKSSIERRNTLHWTMMAARTRCRWTVSNRPISRLHRKTGIPVSVLSPLHQHHCLSLPVPLALADVSTSLND